MLYITGFYIYFIKKCILFAVLGTNFTVGIIMSIYKEKGLIAPDVPPVAHTLNIEMKPPSSFGLEIQRGRLCN